jgi:leader peptidase (prepilin peptidase) / N-methyltransferase
MISPWLLLTCAAAGAPAGYAAAWTARRLSIRNRRVPPIAFVTSCIAIFVWGAAVAPADWRLAASLALGWALLVLAAVDAAELRLPDLLTLPLTAAGLAVSLALPQARPLDHLAGAAAGYLALAALAWTYDRLRGREGLGMGDAKLMAAAGAWLGWAPLPWVVLIACAAAFALIGARTAVRGRRTLRQPFPFGVPLCLAIWIVWLHGAP